MSQSVQIIHKAAGIIIKDKKLLVERSAGKDFYIAPGGKLEQGESAEQALIRELDEEYGIIVQQADLLPFGTFSAAAANTPWQTVQMEVFTVTVWQGEIIAKESQDLQWIDSKTVANIPVGSIFAHDVVPILKYQGLIN